MDDLRTLLNRIAVLERQTAALQNQNHQLRQQLAERDSRIAELEEELRRRGKNYRPKPNAAATPKSKRDRRRKGSRKHPGMFRTPPTPDKDTVHHDVHPEQCPQCGCRELEPTGEFTDHYVEDIPEPRVELHRYRRHIDYCPCCEQVCQGRGDLELPGAHIGPRLRLFSCYARAELGISLEKTADLLREMWGLRISRAGVLGHLRWGSRMFAPVVQELWELLRESPVVHADETGWRINGRNVWCWCFCNARLALFLIDRRRNRNVLVRALGQSLAGVLVADFYAVYDQMQCPKQRCLVHLLRELHQLSETLPAAAVRGYIQPVKLLLQDALALAKRRDQLSAPKFAAAREALYDRLIGLILKKRPSHADCRRIQKRLFKYWEELFTFLEYPEVPADNSEAERTIRSVAAARSDGGTHRADWSATAFAQIKSITRTCRKTGRSFFDYALSLIRASQTGLALPLPVDTG